MMMRGGALLALAVLLIAGAADAKQGQGKGKGPKVCDEAAVAMAQEAIAAACPCEGLTDADGNVVPWRNHGKYVRCVAHATRDLVRASGKTMSRRCLRDAVRCAARSTCGRDEDAVTCSAEDSGECEIVSSVAACEEQGGTAGTGSCCNPVPLGSPSGAFVDGVPIF